MRYFLFIISILFLFGIAIHIIGLNIGETYQRLTSFGYGYLAGNMILIVLFLALAFFSGRKIIKQDLTGPH